MLNGLRETRGVRSEEWRAGGGEARRTPDVRRVESIPIRTRYIWDGLRTAASPRALIQIVNKNVHGCPSSADRHRMVSHNRGLPHPFAFDIPFMFATYALDALGNIFFESFRRDHPTELLARRSHDGIGASAEEGMTAALTD